MNAKRNTGNYLGQYDTKQVQGSYGWYNDPNEGWTAGKFGESFGADSWNPLGERGYAGEQNAYRSSIDQYVSDKEQVRVGTVGGEGEMVRRGTLRKNPGGFGQSSGGGTSRGGEGSTGSWSRGGEGSGG